jgi:Zn-dependent peptidase ImmA (M78 family)
VPVEAIAGDLLGLRIEESFDIDCSGMLLPAERKIVLNAAEVPRDVAPLRRFRFTIAHEIGHWVCHCLSGRAPKLEPSYCRAIDLTDAADRTLEREANIFAAELLMPEPAVRVAWEELGEVEACAARFDVSPTAIQWRLHSFELAARPPSSDAVGESKEHAR